MKMEIELLREGNGVIVPASFSIRFAPSSHLIAVVRRVVQSFYAEILGDSELSSRLALVTHELLENVVKYGTTASAMLGVSIRQNDGDDHEVAVTIRNSASAENIAEAERLIAEIAAADDTFAYYQQQMEIAAEREHGSGLGLVRIAAEAGMSLSSALRDGEFEIEARAHYTPPRSS